MSIKKFNIKINNTNPAYFAKVLDSSNNGVDLTGANILCTMKLKTGGAAKIDRQSAGIVIDPDQVANKGEFEYQWQSGDTDTVGIYNIEFEITLSGGGELTVPSNNSEEPATINVNSSLSSA